MVSMLQKSRVMVRMNRNELRTPHVETLRVQRLCLQETCLSSPGTALALKPGFLAFSPKKKEDACAYLHWLIHCLNHV